MIKKGNNEQDDELSIVEEFAEKTSISLKAGKLIRTSAIA